MGVDTRFWILFGSMWLIVGLAFIGAGVALHVSADPDMWIGSPPTWIFGAIGLPFAVTGGMMILYARNALSRDLRVMQLGHDLTATVIDIRKSAIEINRQTRWLVVYRYQDPTGRQFEGKSRAVLGDAVAELKPGDKVSIRIDAANPAQSIFLGRA